MASRGTRPRVSRHWRALCLGVGVGRGAGVGSVACEGSEREGVWEGCWVCGKCGGRREGDRRGEGVRRAGGVGMGMGGVQAWGRHEHRGGGRRGGGG